MKKEELDKIIEKIENENSKEKAFFGVHIISDDCDEAYIKANKSGLQLYAAELLKASNSVCEIENTEKKIISFNPEEKWINGDIWLAYIEPTIGDRVDLVSEPGTKNWKDKFAIYLFYSILVFIFLILIIGLRTIGKVIISWF